ncbi:unnamed protein product [Polarella glacialis]|uniref:Cyclic nucleotide-binding domain-containing protein n=1 Tax=Polarella glacialis TaxID=89957 RepID=A0A813KGV0_POLGL|nr:unnamed protein product [Polarella glacialis]
MAMLNPNPEELKVGLLSESAEAEAFTHFEDWAKEDAERAQNQRLTSGLLFRLGLQSRGEAVKVFHFMLAALLSNTSFVIGRNVGTALFMHCPALGARYLTTAIFVSGALTVLGGSTFASASKGASSAVVYRWLLAGSSATLAALWIGAVLDRDDNEDSLISTCLFFAIYVAEDFIAMFVAMQCATVAQTAFTVPEAKRLFGLVQLGNSIAAMVVGINIGSVAKAVGAEFLLAVQAIVLLVSLLQNEWIARTYLPGGDAGSRPKKKTDKQHAAAGAEPWWNNGLVLAMAFWGFTVIAVKTIFEYQFNILVGESSSQTEMVALTGYLYAAAGIVATVVNLVGSRACLTVLGMQGAILATPGCLLAVSITILASTSVGTTFAGRVVDLSLRWSINNTVRSVLWIAVPTAQAAAAKPWVEGTVKKLGSAFNALLIAATMYATGGSLVSLSILSLVLTAVLFVCCVRVHSLYLKSMWLRIKRREVRTTGPWHLAQEGPLRGNDQLGRRLLEKLRSGNPSEQLYIVREMGDALSDEDWHVFFSHFHSLPTSVQVRVLEQARKQRTRVPDSFLLGLIGAPRTTPAVTTAAILGVGERKLHEALGCLEVHLGNSEPSVRAAAGVCILKIGWGVGLGVTSSAALLVLEEMLGLSLARTAEPQKRTGLVEAVASTSWRRGHTRRVDVYAGSPKGSPDLGLVDILHRDQRAQSLDFGSPPPDHDSGDSLAATAVRLRRDWDAAIAAGQTSLAVMLGIQLTHVRAALQQSLPSTAEDSMIGTKRRRTLSSDSAMGIRWSEQAAALEMLHQLPVQSRGSGLVSGAGGLLPHDAWLGFLRHPSPKVQVAALAFVCEEDLQHERFREELSLIVECLSAHDTYTAAEDALYRLKALSEVQAEVLKQFRQAVEAQQGLHIHQASAKAALFTRYSPASCIAGLLKFLQRQCEHFSESDSFSSVLSEGLCDELLELSRDLSDSDPAQRLLSTLVDLKANGISVKNELAEKRLKGVATQILRGLAVQQWVRRLASSPLPGNANWLRRYLALPRPPTKKVTGDADESDPSCRSRLESGDSFDDEADAQYSREAAGLAVTIGLRYIEEHIYLQRLQLLQLAILASPTGNMSSTRVLAAWRVLRSGDASAEAAVLEVMDSLLPSNLSGIVLQLLDSSNIEDKLRAGARFFDEFAAYKSDKDPSMPPPWADEWFSRLPGDRLGAELGLVCRFLAFAGAGGKDGHWNGLGWTPPPPPVNAILPKVALLCSPAAKVYADMLSIHVAEIATVAEIVHVSCGEVLCKSGESYIVARGFFRATASGREFGPGRVIQELHALCVELAPVEVVCTSSNGGVVLRVREVELFELMFRLPPKFALGILKTVVKILPAPSQIGGARASRADGRRKSTAFHGLDAASPRASFAESSRRRLSTHAEGGLAMKGVEEYNSEAFMFSTPTIARSTSPTTNVGPGALLSPLPSPQWPIVPVQDVPKMSLHSFVVVEKSEQEEDSAPELEDEKEDEEDEQEEEDKLATLARQLEQEDDREQPDGKQGVSDPGSGDEVFGQGPSLMVQTQSRSGRAEMAFSMLEKLILLQAVKMFRYVPIEYLPSVAAACSCCFYQEGEDIFSEGEQTAATLYIVAEGVVGVKQGGILHRKLQVSDSMGNTALLLDHNWQYTATAMEDTWLLCLGREGLTDLLRGRRELASAVIRGLYKTLQRRMCLVEELESTFSMPHERNFSVSFA